MVRIIEGNWDELVKREDLRGRHVRVLVEEPGDAWKLQRESPEEWLKLFHEWVHSHEPVDQFVDDSRDSIYSGTMDDPR